MSARGGLWKKRRGRRLRDAKSRRRQRRLRPQFLREHTTAAKSKRVWEAGNQQDPWRRFPCPSLTGANRVPKRPKGGLRWHVGHLHLLRPLDGGSGPANRRGSAIARLWRLARRRTAAASRLCGGDRGAAAGGEGRGRDLVGGSGEIAMGAGRGGPG